MIPKSVKEAYERIVTPEKFPDAVDTVLLECIDAETGLPVNAICVITQKGHNVEAIPVAVMTTYDIRKRLIPPKDLEFE